MFPINAARSICLLAPLLGAVVSVGAAQPEPKPDSAAPERRVLILGVDGLKPDALAAANTPAIDALIASGTYNDNAQCEDLTFSGPNWSTILHGVHRDRHGVVNNAYMPTSLGGFPDVFTHLEAAQPELVTARLTTWDMIHQRQPTGADLDLFRSYEDAGDAFVTQQAVQLLLGDHPEVRAPHAMFVYLGDVDIAGHTHGFHQSVPGYLAAIETADVQIGAMMEQVRAREAAANEAWLIVLTSDHGGNIDKGHAGNTIDRRTIPFLVSGSLAHQGTWSPEPKNVDVVPTVLAYLGVEPLDLSDSAGTGALDGHVVGLERQRPFRASFDTNLIINPGGEHDRGFTAATIDQAIAGWVDPGPGMMSVMAYGSEGGWPDAATPGPEDRGRNFFMGGTAPISEITQDIDLNAISARFNRGRIRFTLSGWFGGFGIQDDHAMLKVEFFGPEGYVLGGHTAGPVTAKDRDFQTALLYRETTGPVPHRAVSARVTLRSVQRAGEASDGYADNLSLVIHSR